MKNKNAQTQIKICPYCDKEFEVSINSTQKHCTTTCKNYASRERRGHRPPRVKVKSTGSEQEKLDFEQKLSTYQNEIRNLYRYAIDIKNKLNSMEVKSNSKEKERLEELEEMISEWNILTKGESPEERAESEVNKAKILQEINKLKSFIDKVQHHREEFFDLEDKFNNSLLPIFKKTQERNQFYFTNRNGAKELKDLDLDRFTAFQTKYPFKSKYSRFEFLSALGNPPQPFVLSVEGEKGSGKSILAVGTTSTLVKYFQSECLFVSTPKELVKSLKYVKELEIDRSLLTVVSSDSVNDITEALKNKQYEFLIIDGATSFSMSSQMIKSIHSKHPFLSIILTGENIPQGIKNNSYALVKCEHYEDRGLEGQLITRGSNPVIFIDGNSVDSENDHNIFVERFTDSNFGKSSFQISIGM